MPRLGLLIALLAALAGPADAGLRSQPVTAARVAVVLKLSAIAGAQVERAAPARASHEALVRPARPRPTSAARPPSARSPRRTERRFLRNRSLLR